MSKKNKIKFYKTNWFMWLMLVFFGPVGIALLCLKKDIKFTRKTKGILSATFTVLFVLTTTGCGEKPKDDKLVLTQIENSSNQDKNVIQSETDSNKDKFEINIEKDQDNNDKNELSESDGDVDKTESKINADLFEGYTLIEVDGGDLSGNRLPNVVVDIGFGDREYYAFTNEYCQLVKVIAKEIILQSNTEPLTSSGRYYSDEAKVPGTESPDLDEGHVIADSLGGVSNAYNITPQNSTLNRHGDQAYMEKVIRDAGGCTDFVAIITYPDTTTQIPSHYSFTYTLNGNVINDEFDNINPEKANSDTANSNSGTLDNSNNGSTNTSNGGSVANSNNGSADNTNSNTSTPTQPSTPEQPSAPSNGQVLYWTPNGKSYHTTKSCPTLSRSKTILEGTLQQSGKSDPCDRCH